MNSTIQASRSSITSAIFEVLDPIPFGFFVAALVFDILYVQTFTILWVKAAAWLLSIGLLFAIVPQLINLGRTWFTRGRTRALAINFWLQVVAAGGAQDALDDLVIGHVLAQAFAEPFVPGLAALGLELLRVFQGVGIVAGDVAELGRPQGCVQRVIE